LIRHTDNSQPTITWADMSNAEDYQILVINEWTGAVAAVGDGVRSPTFTPAQPLSPGSYFVWVRARNHVGDSAWSLVHMIVKASDDYDDPLV
jgi:hypothetical protein